VSKAEASIRLKSEGFLLKWDSKHVSGECGYQSPLAHALRTMDYLAADLVMNGIMAAWRIARRRRAITSAV